MFSVHSRLFVAEYLDLEESRKKRLNLQEMSDLPESDMFV